MQMKIIGIDLSGPRNFADTCLVSFEERGEEIHLMDVREGKRISKIVTAVEKLIGLFRVDSDQRHVIILPGAVFIFHQCFKQLITT